MPHPVDRMTHAEAAELLGVHPGSVARWVVEGTLRPISPYAKAGLLRADVERLSLARWREGDPSWLTAAQVAERLGVTRPRVYQPSDAGRRRTSAPRTAAPLAQLSIPLGAEGSAAHLHSSILRERCLVVLGVDLGHYLAPRSSPWAIC